MLYLIFEIFKLIKAKKDEESNKDNKNVGVPSGRRKSPVRSTHVRRPAGNVPLFSPPKARSGILGANYQSNYLIRNASQYLGPHIFTTPTPITNTLNSYANQSNIPRISTEITCTSDNQNQSTENNQTRDREIKPKVISGVEAQADETLSKMLGKTEGDLSLLKLQVENDMHPEQAKNMVHTLNTAKNQVENLRRTAEKVRTFYLCNV